MFSRFWLYSTLAVISVVVSISLAIASAQDTASNSAIIQRYFELLAANRETDAYSLHCNVDVNYERIPLGQIETFEIIKLEPQTVYGLTYTNVEVKLVPIKSTNEAPGMRNPPTSAEDLFALMEVWRSDDYYQANITRVERVNARASTTNIEKPSREQFNRNTFCVVMRMSAGNIRGRITWP